MNALPFRIVEERTEATRVEMIENGDEEIFIELESVRKLFRDLPHTVNKLQEYGRTIRVRVVIVSVTDALHEGQLIDEFSLIFKTPF